MEINALDYTDDQIDAMVAPLFGSLKDRVQPGEMDKIKMAFEFARKAHAGQKRKTGEPYIIHPIAVARIVGEEWGLGANPVCAAFLHDVVEDTKYTDDDISRLFGKDVAFLVRVVTKQKKEHYDTSKQVDNFKQMLNSINYDIRALLIKLADRLHNMRTLSSMLPHKQMKIAGETDYFYAPLANRLGLYRVKIELENLGFRYRCPRDFVALERQLAADEQNTKHVVDAFIAKADAKLKEHGIVASIECDYRRPFSIRRKMLKSGQDFNHVEHKKFVRVVFDDPADVSEKGMAMKIYSLLSDVFKEKPKSMANYIDSPKQNGYRSLHGEFLDDSGQWMEVHISSRRMRHFSRFGCIADREEGSISKWIENLKSTLQDIAYHNHEIGFMEGVVASFYNDDITVFTPHGRSIVLPKGSTALDFAFEIHTEVGMRAKYARVNGKLCSVVTVLKRGDCVEIGTEPDAVPSPDWLKNVTTYKAKRNLRSWLLAQPKTPISRCRHCNPMPGDEVIGFKLTDKTVEVHRRDCPVAISRASQEGDRVVAVDFKPDNTVYPIRLHLLAVDRYHMLSEIVDCVTSHLQLPIEGVSTQVDNHIVGCDLDFSVHSYDELQTAIDSLNAIDGVDEVWRVNR